VHRTHDEYIHVGSLAFHLDQIADYALQGADLTTSTAFQHQLLFALAAYADQRAESPVGSGACHPVASRVRSPERMGEDRTLDDDAGAKRSPQLFVGDSETVMVVHEMLREGQIVRRIPLRRCQRLVVGRDDGADIVLQSATASRRHFALEVTPTGAVFVEDLSSCCGTLVNDERIDHRQLEQGDVLKVGSSVYLTFQQGEDVGKPTHFEKMYSERALAMPPGLPLAGSR